eukprot:TRINITY_DN1418_c0_g1_i4.p2 TRINITY_DN1418_c0_g1~~TRINITY_DN1418_c0_g1_i4.p2  ORF type:complete len:290 (-),score=55.32 TRINITY_DN1418_c0_g1_i4:408-1277(-)
MATPRAMLRRLVLLTGLVLPLFHFSSAAHCSGGTCQTRPASVEDDDVGEALLQRTRGLTQIKASESTQALEEEVQGPDCDQVYSTWDGIADSATLGADDCLQGPEANVVSTQSATSVSFRFSESGSTQTIGLALGSDKENAQSHFALRIEADDKISLGDSSNGGALASIYGSAEVGNTFKLEFIAPFTIKWLKDGAELHQQIFMVPWGEHLYAYGSVSGGESQMCSLSYTGCPPTPAPTPFVFPTPDPTPRPTPEPTATNAQANTRANSSANPRADAQADARANPKANP